VRIQSVNHDLKMTALSCLSPLLGLQILLLCLKEEPRMTQCERLRRIKHLNKVIRREVDAGLVRDGANWSKRIPSGIPYPRRATAPEPSVASSSSRAICSERINLKMALNSMACV
jgi:hypothetical protein